MTPTRDLATTFARAVLDRIDDDRCCNSENITDAIFREMAVAAATDSQPVSNQFVHTVTVSRVDAENFMTLLQDFHAPSKVIGEARRLLLSGVRI